MNHNFIDKHMHISKIFFQIEMLIAPTMFVLSGDSNFGFLALYSFVMVHFVFPIKVMFEG